jgi:hypothetical protein
MAGGYEHADGLRCYLDRLQAVAIVVDLDFGDGLQRLLDRMPVWIADTDANRAAAARAPYEGRRSKARITRSAGR